MMTPLCPPIVNENWNRNDKTVGKTLISRLANSPPKLVHWKWSSGFIATIDLAIVTLQSTHHLVIWGNDCLPPITSYLWHKLWYDFQLFLNLIVFFFNFGCLQYLTHFHLWQKAMIWSSPHLTCCQSLAKRSLFVCNT